MGQAATAPATWCGEGQQIGGDITDWANSQPILARNRSRPAGTVQDPAEADRLLAGCPRELAETLRQAGQLDILRCRSWLSAGAFRGLQRSLQRCQLQKLMERYQEAETPEECTYIPPVLIPWAELDADHVISAGQVFRSEDATQSKLFQLRRLGLTVLRQGKVGVVLLAGGANLRLGCGEPPVACTPRITGLHSGKSILQLCCERIRRIATLCRGPEDSKDQQRAALPRPSIPVFVMTSRLTHRKLVEHFEANRYFGLPARDVFFFEQPVGPVLNDQRQLLPQSLGGEFAHAPTGTGAMLSALANSSALEQMRDRGVECLHVVGTENLLVRVCDPTFIGFCRELDIDCACKIAARLDAFEDIDLFCIKQSPVTTQYADMEEAACGLPQSEAPPEVLEECTETGGLSYLGSINSFFFSVTYIEEVVLRPVRAHRLPRVLPYLDFYTDAGEQPPPDDPVPPEFEPAGDPSSGNDKQNRHPAGVAPGSWPAETTSPDLACQRALLSAAAEVRAIRRPGPGDCEEAWRCEVHLDGNGPMAVVKVRTATRGPLLLPDSIAAAERGLPSLELVGITEDQQLPNGLLAVGVVGGLSRQPPSVSEDKAAAGLGVTSGPPSASSASRGTSEKRGVPNLRCNLVVPSKANAFVLEVSLLDYFAYTDRAVALEVQRDREFAPVRTGVGLHSPEAARRTLHLLHRSWFLNGGGKLEDPTNMNAIVEVSPLLSYEGEGLVMDRSSEVALAVPLHLPGQEEVSANTQVLQAAVDARAVRDDPSNIAPEDMVDGLDTRLFYLQEYPHRIQMSHSHTPQFRSCSRGVVEDQRQAQQQQPKGATGSGGMNARVSAMPTLPQVAAFPLTMSRASAAGAISTLFGPTMSPPTRVREAGTFGSAAPAGPQASPTLRWRVTAADG